VPVTDKDSARFGTSAGKITDNSVFLTTWHCILSALLAKAHSFRLFFGDFAHWDKYVAFENVRFSK